MEITHQKPQKETNALTKQPNESSENLLKIVTQIQKAYRTELDEGELELWLRGLSEVSIGEIMPAIQDLMLHPPKYELNGEIQVWRGMPKLPDVLQKITEIRDFKASMLRTNPPKFPECADCDGTGWIEIQQESRTHPGRMIPKSVRCACRKNFKLTGE